MDTPKPPTKYRASCDGCYLAKLKCSKEKPTCPRCKNLGLKCTYSPSQRTGKHRACKSQASSSGSATTTTTAATNTTTTTTITTPSSTATAPSPSQVLEWQPTVSSRPSTIVPTDTLAHPFDPVSFDQGSFAPSHDSPHSLMDTTMSNWPSSATTLHDLDSNLLAPWREYLPNPDRDDSLFRMSDDLVGGFPGMTPSPTDHQSLTTMDGTLSHNLHTCNCFVSITQALHELHDQSRRPSTPALEATLSCSKEVTARGEMLLNCTCTEDSTLVMLFAALIAKYLSLYATNIDLIASPSCTSLADIAADPATSRVTIGKYTMDAEDEERLRMEIILMELQKLNTLLVKFRGKFASVDVGYEGHTYETMLDFLNTRLREAMKKLQRQKQRYQA